MHSYMMGYKKSCALMLAIGIFSCVACNAGRGGGDYHNNDHPSYNNSGNNDNNGSYYHDDSYHGGLQ